VTYAPQDRNAQLAETATKLQAEKLRLDALLAVLFAAMLLKC
jgi:hypothetical protein